MSFERGKLAANLGGPGTPGRLIANHLHRRRIGQGQGTGRDHELVHIQRRPHASHVAIAINKGIVNAAIPGADQLTLKVQLARV